MSKPVEVGLVTSNSFPSGTGSYSYKGNFQIVVENLDYEKQVTIWAQTGSGWNNINASYAESLPENRELWIAPASNAEGKFVARYTVNGATFWDNNHGSDYNFPKAYDEFLVLPGENYKVILGNAGLSGGVLTVDIGAQNLAYNKIIGIVYTIDNWATTQYASAYYASTMETGLEIWHTSVNVGSASDVQFAIFYQVEGDEYWDNNFWRNYHVSPGHPQQWATNN